MRDENGPLLRHRREQWVEPLWKSVLSNKGLMPLLWRFFPNHPNLLPARFDGETPQIAAGESYVRKPIFSREGEMSPFLMVSSRSLSMPRVITPKNR